MADPIRIAIAGLGLIGRRHADAIAQARNVAFCAGVDPSADGQAFARRRSVPCYETIEEMLDDQSVDGVIIATPTPMHIAMARDCVSAGCPVLIEKPIATRAEDARALVEQAEASGVPVLVGHHRRYNPIIQKAHAMIAEGMIGDVRAVHATCWFHKPTSYFDIAPWRKQTGAGPISVNLVHDVDLIRYLVGDVAEVQGSSAPSKRGYENEDVAAAVLRFHNGAIGTITVSDSIASPWSWEFTAGENPVYPHVPQSCYMIGGTLGSISVPDLRVWSHGEGEPDWWSPMSAMSVPCDLSDPLVNQVTHFAEVIRKEAEPNVTGREGLRTLQVIESMQIACKHSGSILIED